MNKKFEVGLTRDFLADDGTFTYRDLGLSVFEQQPLIHHRFFEKHESPMTPSQLKDVDAIISLTPRYTKESFRGVERLAAIVRFGVGYEMVDISACTEADILLCITTGATSYSVAEAVVGWMLALNHKMFIKDRLLREGRWTERVGYMGTELRDRTLGIVGLGGIGRALVEMVSGFKMKQPIAYDPFADPKQAAAIGVKLVSLEDLMKQSDFVSVNCPLNDQTRDLIGREQLALMKPEAFLINSARGGIVNEQALIEALRAGRIAGAAVDVFENEPVKTRHPLAELNNVILAPHCIAWTDELFRDIGRMACQMVVQIAHGKIPHGVINPEVLQREGFQRKLARFMIK
jgi:phosphoglycerate dehydrogenase-like enzyme